jgi:tetratricopeptide (TPR) repeat protein
MINNAMKLLNKRASLTVAFYFMCSVIVTAHIYSAYCHDKVSPLIKAGRYEEAFIKYKKIASDSTSNYDKRPAYYELGHFFAHGHGVPVNVDSALFYLNLAAKMGSNRSLRLMSMIYYLPKYSRQDLSKSFDYLKLAAESDIIANLELGELYLTGKTRLLVDTIIISTHKTVNYNGDSIVERGHSHKIRSTGIVISYPFVEIDSVKGFYYYERGKDINHPLINEDYMLKGVDFAESYMYGTHSEVDYDVAYSYLSSYASLQKDLDNDNDSAIVRNDPELAKAYWLLQIVYRYGVGTRTNIQKADMFLRLAAKYGSQKAIKALELLGTE